MVCIFLCCKMCSLMSDITYKNVRSIEISPTVD